MAVILPYQGTLPTIASRVYLADTAAIIGDVGIEDESSIWFGAVLRGDVNPIRVGARTSIQDNSVLHATTGLSETHVGSDVTVGHGVILHGCTIGDRVVVGMGSIVLDLAEIGSDVVLGAGSLVTQNTKIPPGVLAHGRPAKPVRDLRKDELERILEGAAHYVEKCRQYRALSPTG